MQIGLIFAQNFVNTRMQRTLR